MGKSLVIPGADFSAVAIPFIAKVTIAANKVATIYSGDGNAIATIPATAKEKTIDLTDILSEGTPTLYDFTFARQAEVFKKVWINVDNATTLAFALYCVAGSSSILEDVLFSGNNELGMSLESVLANQGNIKSVDLSCLKGDIVSVNTAFFHCEKVESINLSKIKSIGTWTLAFQHCNLLKTIDLSSLQTIGDTTPSAGEGPFVGSSAIETILCPALGVTGAKKLIKELSAGPNLLCKYGGGNITKVDMSRFTYQYGTPVPATMTLWDENVWDNPVVGTTYYVDASVNRLYTYNG